MWLRVKNFNITGVHWKIQFLVGVPKKPIYRGELPKKEGLGPFPDLRRGGGGLGKKEGGGVFGGGALIT